MHLFVAILENCRHLGFSIYQSDRIYLITIEMSPANFGACITICTIHPTNTTYLLNCKSVTTCPNGNVTTCPNVISITKIIIVEKYGVPTSSDLYTRFSIFTSPRAGVYPSTYKLERQFFRTGRRIAPKFCTHVRIETRTALT